MKLKVVYTLVEQLYTGTQRTLPSTSPTGQTATLLRDVLKKLSVLPTRFEEMKKSSARAGAVKALSRAKAWVPDLDPTDVAMGYPSLKEDDTLFSQQDFAACVKAIRPLATLMANESDLSKYQSAYDQDNKRVASPLYLEKDLIPPISKHTFSPEIDPSELIDDEAEFEGLSGIDWSSQPEMDEEEPAKGDTEVARSQAKELTR